MTPKPRGLVYLAQPYTHKLKYVRKEREEKGCQVAAFLLSKGILIYSPIAETTAIAKDSDIKNTDWNFWRKKDLALLKYCKEMWILCLNGWTQSKGVRGEVKFCLKNNIKIRLAFILKKDELTITSLKKQYLLQCFDVKTVEELNN